MICTSNNYYTCFCQFIYINLCLSVILLLQYPLSSCFKGSGFPIPSLPFLLMSFIISFIFLTIFYPVSTIEDILPKPHYSTSIISCICTFPTSTSSFLFNELIFETDFEKITVKSLSEKAKINKKTFYTYYSSLNDLLLEYQEKTSSEYIEQILKYRIPENFDKITREFFLFSEKYGEAYEKITSNEKYLYNKTTNDK